jgi:hypothetical protein
MIDKDSPPGAWKSEMERMPWKYSQQTKLEEALASIRQAGFQYEANLIALEITTLKNEIEALRDTNTTR